MRRREFLFRFYRHPLEFFLKKVRLGINEYVLSLKTIAELNVELDDKLVIYKKKKKFGREIGCVRKKN